MPTFSISLLILWCLFWYTIGIIVIAINQNKMRWDDYIMFLFSPIGIVSMIVGFIVREIRDRSKSKKLKIKSSNGEKENS